VSKSSVGRSKESRSGKKEESKRNEITEASEILGVEATSERQRKGNFGGWRGGGGRGGVWGGGRGGKKTKKKTRGHCVCGGGCGKQKTPPKSIGKQTGWEKHHWRVLPGTSLSCAKEFMGEGLRGKLNGEKNIDKSRSVIVASPLKSNHADYKKSLKTEKYNIHMELSRQRRKSAQLIAG